MLQSPRNVRPAHACGAARAVLAVLVVSAFTAAASGNTFSFYARADAPPGGDGLTWATAHDTIAEAIALMRPGDTLRTDGVFHEAVTLDGFHGTRWIGNAGPTGETWLRNDVYRPMGGPDGWADAGGGVWSIAWPDRPASVVYDYRRDTAGGAITGVALPAGEELVYLGVPGGVFFGHLRRSDDAGSPVPDGAWRWTDSGGGLLEVNPPGDVTFNPTLCGICPDGRSGAYVLNSVGTRLTGVNTMLFCGTFNAAYGIRGVNLTSSTFEDCTIVDAGWHAAGMAASSRFENSLRNIRSFGHRATSSGTGLANPFVFYTDRPGMTFAGHVGEDLLYHAYPLLAHDGAPMTAEFSPVLALSHGDPQYRHGGIVWRRCRMIDHSDRLEAAHGVALKGIGGLISAADIPEHPSDDPDAYSIRVLDSQAIGRGARPAAGVLFERCLFDRSGSVTTLGNTTALVRVSERGAYFRACVIHTGVLAEGEALFEGTGDGLFFDACTIYDAGRSSAGGLVWLSAGSTLGFRASIYARENAGPVLRSWPSGWGAVPPGVAFAANAYPGVTEAIRHSNPGFAPLDLAFLGTQLDPNARLDLGAEFMDAPAGDLTPIPGSDLEAARVDVPFADLVGTLGINGQQYSGSFGAHQAGLAPGACPADLNRDGVVDLDDFSVLAVGFGAGPGATIDQGDITNDGFVNLDDFSQLAINFGCIGEPG